MRGANTNSGIRRDRVILTPEGKCPTCFLLRPHPRGSQKQPGNSFRGSAPPYSFETPRSRLSPLQHLCSRLYRTSATWNRQKQRLPEENTCSQHRRGKPQRAELKGHTRPPPLPHSAPQEKRPRWRSPATWEAEMAQPGCGAKALWPRRPWRAPAAGGLPSGRHRPLCTGPGLPLRARRGLPGALAPSPPWRGRPAAAPGRLRMRAAQTPTPTRTDGKGPRGQTQLTSPSLAPQRARVASSPAL